MAETLRVDGREVPVTSLDKVLYPETGTTKGEVLTYLVRAAPALLPELAARPMREDMTRQLDALVHPGFVAETGYARLRHLQRYVRGILWRAQRGPDDVRRDDERQAVVATVEREYREFLQGLRPARVDAPDVVEIRWMIEELRVSLFAQSLGTAHPVSEQRIYKAMDAAESR